MLKKYEEKILSNLIDELEKVTDEDRMIMIGEMEENYHIGNGEFEKITGSLWLKLNHSEKYRVIGNNKKGELLIDDFDIWDSEANVKFIDNLEIILLEFIDDVFEKAKENYKDKMLVKTKNFKK